MGQLIRMPKQVRPFALSVTPALPGCLSKFVLTATAWNSDDAAICCGFVSLPDMLDELSDLGADSAMMRSVSRALEAGSACVIPKLWLTPSQLELFRKPAKAAGSLREFAPGASAAMHARHDANQERILSTR